jgi:hypothetical protein
MIMTGLLQEHSGVRQGNQFADAVNKGAKALA